MLCPDLSGTVAFTEFAPQRDQSQAAMRASWHHGFQGQGHRQIGQDRMNRSSIVSQAITAEFQKRTVSQGCIYLWPVHTERRLANTEA